MKLKLFRSMQKAIIFFAIRDGACVTANVPYTMKPQNRQQKWWPEEQQSQQQQQQ